jgi:hypothetical protein
MKKAVLETLALAVLVFPLGAQTTAKDPDCVCPPGPAKSTVSATARKTSVRRTTSVPRPATGNVEVNVEVEAPPAPTVVAPPAPPAPPLSPSSFDKLIELELLERRDRRNDSNREVESELRRIREVEESRRQESAEVIKRMDAQNQLLERQLEAIERRAQPSRKQTIMTVLSLGMKGAQTYFLYDMNKNLRRIRNSAAIGAMGVQSIQQGIQPSSNPSNTMPVINILQRINGGEGGNGGIGNGGVAHGGQGGQGNGGSITAPPEPRPNPPQNRHGRK